MKKLPLLMLAAGFFALTSCSEDDSTASGEVTADLVGTYELTALTAPGAQDYDGDGDSSENLVLEGSCYNDSWISFHSDGTYDESSSSSVAGNGGLTLSCDTKTATGTYTKSGNTVTTTRVSGEGSVTGIYKFSAGNHTLKRTEAAGTYPGFNSATSLFASLSGSLQLTFTKYTDNDEDNGANDSDDNNTDTGAVAALIGNFDLTSFIVATAQDLDDDGDSSTNLMTESNCYTDSSITFHSDGTYDETSAASVLAASGLSLECDSETTTGTWMRNGNIVIMHHATGSLNVSTQYAFNSTTHVLTRTDNAGQYPGFNTATSVFTALSGNVGYTFAKD